MSLALVMVTATALLAAFLFEAHASQTERLSPLLGRQLAQEARTIRLGYPAGESGASWFIVSPNRKADPLTRGGVELDARGFELAAEALERVGGVKKRAAQLLSISFRSFRYRHEKLGLDDDSSHES